MSKNNCRVGRSTGSIGNSSPKWNWHNRTDNYNRVDWSTGSAGNSSPRWNWNNQPDNYTRWTLGDVQKINSTYISPFLIIESKKIIDKHIIMMLDEESIIELVGMEELAIVVNSKEIYANNIPGCEPIEKFFKKYMRTFYKKYELLVRNV